MLIFPCLFFPFVILDYMERSATFRLVLKGLIRFDILIEKKGRWDIFPYFLGFCPTVRRRNLQPRTSHATRSVVQSLSNRFSVQFSFYLSYYASIPRNRERET